MWAAFIAIAAAVSACLLDTSGLSGGATTQPDSGSLDSGTVVDSGNGPPPDSGGSSGTTEAGTSSGGTPLFDQGTSWPVSTSAKTASPTTPTFTTSAACTDLIVLANNGAENGTATITSSTGMTFTEVAKDANNSADTIYIWRATSACASKSGTVTVNWSVPAANIIWANVAVFAFTHSNGIGATAAGHSPGTVSINTIAITPKAAGSWLFASLSGNGEKEASSVGTAGDFVQEFDNEGAIQSFGTAAVPTPTTAGMPVTFSLPTPDDIWANAAVEVLSQ
jgi:hypothetical protein